MITPSKLGDVIIRRCGHECEWPHNTPQQIREREFLQKGIRFLADVVAKERIDPANAALIFCIPGRDFCVLSGKHSWEFFIFEVNGEIQARCRRIPTYRWLWKADGQCWCRIVNYERNFAFQALIGRPYVPEKAVTQGVRCVKGSCRHLNNLTTRQCMRCGRPLM